MKEILAKLVEGKDLTKEEAMKAQELILTGQATGLCRFCRYRRRLYLFV